MTPSDLTLGTAVDWRFAATVGQRLARPGPASSEYTCRQAVDELAGAAAKAEPPVRDVTGLVTDGPIPGPRRGPAAVDRRGRRVDACDDERQREAPGFLTGRVTGAQTGAVLAFVSSGILGQYDPFAEAKQGRLLLVYPNVIAVERQLRVQPSDFRLWVCLHEVTHRVQFSANRWLSGYMSQALEMLTRDTGEDIGKVAARLADYARTRGVGAAAPDANSSGILGLVRAVQSEPQRNALDQLLVLGTLLEGHADHVMDAVGPMVVPSVATIRRRFDERRNRKQPPLQRLLRALLGLDAKLSQYTRGKAFVDHVVGRVGMERFNTVWSGPDTLPLPSEIEEPQRWIDRVL